METYLSLDKNSKQLCLFAKKNFEHSSDVSLKVRGVLNTVTAQTQIDSSLNKYFRFGKQARYAEGDVYRPDQRLRLGISALSSSSSEDVLLSLSAKQVVRLAKSTDIVRGRQVLNSYTQATLKAHYDYNVRSEVWSGEVIASASHAVFKFNDDQDVRVTAGCRVPLTASGAGVAQPYLRLEENCWSVQSDLKGGWMVRYAL